VPQGRVRSLDANPGILTLVSALRICFALAFSPSTASGHVHAELCGPVLLSLPLSAKHSAAGESAGRLELVIPKPNAAEESAAKEITEMNRSTILTKLTVVIFTVLLFAVAGAAAGTETALKASDITSKIFPEQVFFRGQVAPVQMRNTGGVRFSDDMFVLAGMVDSSGYSTAIRQKYQAYFISEVPLEISGQKLPPGAYGIGFISGEKFILMDLGAHDLFEVDSSKDSEMKRPVPLQVVSSGGKYRLYAGRSFVEFARAQ